MLSFATPDGNFTAKIGGRIFFIYRHIFDVQDGSGAIGSPPALLAGRGGDPDTFGIDTVRMMLEGTFFKDFFYRAEAEAQSQADAGRFRMKDLYMGWHALPDILSIWAGQQKTPWSQEETTSGRFIDFGERSILNRLAPAHDVGILVKGSLADRVLEWNLGVFNGALARDQGRNATDLNSEKDLVGRLFVTPLKGSSTRLFQQLRLGLDFTWGPRDTQALGGGITTGDLGPTLVNPFNGHVTQADGTQSRWLLNFSWIYGPWSLRAEYGIVDTELVETAPQDSFRMKAGYVQATWLLTGEDKPLENRVKPRANLSLTEGTWGAFELAARVAFLDTSDGEDAGVVLPTTNQRTTELTLGLNWWWTPNVCLRIDWERFRFDEDRPVKTGATLADQLEDHQDVFYVRWQIDF
jgi:phosphate-selective porin OprO/OprP